MAKAKKAKQSTQLPLDDTRWRSVPEIIERHFPHSDKDNKKLIARDLTERVESEKIHCMRRHTREGHPEPVPASFWADHCFACSRNGDIRVAFRPPPNSGLSFYWIEKWAFYLWQPDCERVWPALAPQAVAARKAEAGEPLRRKPGPRPTKEWKLFIAHTLYILQEAGKPTPTAGELAELCQDELGYEPDESAINLWLRELGRLLS
jgi:hypothetical protein